MQGWLVVGAWVFAVLFAVVLLGFAAYELSWKSRRLLADRARLEQLVGQLGEVAGQLQAGADRLR
ncbi:MAG: hypothetical protein ACR2N4_09360 [Jatrophihabitans sp.]